MAAGLDWQRDGPTWPHAERSRFVDAAGQRWHVQHWPHAGAPLLLLLHGTGASTHSWRDLAPRLAARFALVAVDLPGHGFSGPARRGAAGMTGMAEGLTALLQVLGARPAAVVGHSAGAAIAARMALDDPTDAAAQRPLIGLNAALLPLAGLAGTLFAPAAKLLALNPLAPRFFAWQAADPRVLARLLHGTGSRLNAEGVALYRRLVASPGHVAGALAMMAQWDLPALAAQLPKLRAPLHLVVGEGDATIPPVDAERVQARVAGCTVDRLPGLGHLAHEEDPQAVAALISALLGSLAAV